MKTINVISADAATNKKPIYRKPFISLDIHERLKKISNYFGYYYNTDEGTLFIKGKKHRILFVGENLYFQHEREQLVSLNHEEKMMSLMQNNGFVGLDIFFK